MGLINAIRMRITAAVGIVFRMTISGLMKLLNDRFKPAIIPRIEPEMSAKKKLISRRIKVPARAVYVFQLASKEKNRGITTCGPGNNVDFTIDERIHHNAKIKPIPKIVHMMTR